jgi:uncharacterized membrane protein
VTEVARAGSTGRGSVPTRAGGPPQWAVPASLALAVLGLGLSIYLTIEHYTAPGTLACVVTENIDCAQVTTSAQSKFLGIPVAVLGIVFFAAATVLCLPPLWRRLDRRLWQARLGVAGLGVLFVVYLIFAELFIIEAFCLWCTAVHLVAFGLFAVVALASAMADPSPFDRR